MRKHFSCLSYFTHRFIPFLLSCHLRLFCVPCYSYLTNDEQMFLWSPVEIVKSGQNCESWPKSNCILKEMAVLCPSVIARHKGEKATELFMAKSESLLCYIEKTTSIEIVYIFGNFLLSLPWKSTKRLWRWELWWALSFSVGFPFFFGDLYFIDIDGGGAWRWWCLSKSRWW